MEKTLPLGWKKQPKEGENYHLSKQKQEEKYMTMMTKEDMKEGQERPQLCSFLIKLSKGGIWILMLRFVGKREFSFLLSSLSSFLLFFVFLIDLSITPFLSLNTPPSFLPLSSSPPLSGLRPQRKGSHER